MPSANCFDAPTLKDYLLGRLSEEQSDVVAAHLEACLSCEATVSQLDRASDTLTNGLRLPAVAADPQTDDELQKALNKVQSLEALREHPTSEVSADRSPVLRDYRLLEPLGSGGMGQVFKAVHTRLDRLVAVKLLPARRLGDDQAVARFQREMRVIGQLSHPAIVQATDAGEVDGTHFLVMEYVEGCDLNTLAKVCGPLSIADACEITRQAALGLEYAHQQGIVHRDIKPSNLMLSRNSEFGGRKSERQATASDSDFRPPNSPFLKILDLGLALLSGVQAPVDELTTVGQLMGTLDYMAPEQLEDSHLVGPRADIYALAATLFRLLTGFSPFANENRKTPLQKLRALATQAAPPIRERRADLPLDLAAIIDRALSRDPANRFASMSEFAAAVVPWSQGHNLAELSHRVRESAAQSVGQVFNLPVARSQSGRRPVRETNRQPTLSGQVEPLPHGPRRRMLIAALLAFIGFVALGIVITIETNKGTLIVESVREGVEVRVKKSGKSVEKLELTTGPKSTRLAAGEYEIEIVGDADGLRVDRQKVELTRGGEVLVRVTEVPAVATIAPTTPKPGAGFSPMVGSPGITSAVSSPDIERPAPEPDNEKPNPTAKGIDQFLAEDADRRSETKYREALRRQLDLKFEDKPLVEVVRTWQEFAKLPMWIDEAALTEEGIATDAPINIEFKKVSLATAMVLTLRPLQLAYFWDDTQVVITTAAKANEKLVNRSYPVGRSLPMVRKAVRLLEANDVERRIELIKAGVKPEAPAAPAGGGGFFAVPCSPGPCGLDDPLSSNSTNRPTHEGSGYTDRLHFQFGGGGFVAGAGGVDGYGIPLERTAVSYYSHLLELLTNAQWQDSDGEGGTVSLLGDVLFVRQTRPAHQQVEAALRILELAAAGTLPNSPVEIRRPDYPLDGDRKLAERLAEVIEVEIGEAPLRDALRTIEPFAGTQILLDEEKLIEEGIASDSPVALPMTKLPLKAVLQRMLDPLQLAVEIEEGLLIVTTKAAAAERLVTRVYEVRKLLARGIEGDDLIASLESGTTGPWMNVEGEGGETTVFADRLLYVTQTRPNHDEVAAFLRDLDAKLGQQPAKKPGSSKPKPVVPSQGGGFGGAPTPAPVVTQPEYDGKTFDQWLAVLDVERSPARLADAFQALRLLHQDNQAEKVAQRVLTVFRLADPGAVYGDTTANRRQIVSDATELLEALPANVVQAAAASELGSGNSRSRKFLFGYVLTRSDNTLRIVFPQLPKAVLAVSRDSDASVRASALSWLTALPRTGIGSEAIPEATKRFREALSDKAPEVAYWGAKGLLDSESDTAAVVESLKRLMGTPKDTSGLNEVSTLQGESLILAAVMGPRAAAAAPTIAPFLLLRNSTDGNQGFTIGNRGGPGSVQLSIKSLAALALARIGKAAAATLPTVAEALEQDAGPSRTFASGFRVAPNQSGFDAGMAFPPRGYLGRLGPISFRELLIAAKSRLEERPAADPKDKPTDVKVEDVALALSAIRLLETEQTLLEFHYGSGSEQPELRELDQKLKAAETSYDALRTLNDEQRGKLPRGTGPSAPASKPEATKLAPETSKSKVSNDGASARYDGKSFDEWLAILDTERSPARVADAIEALRLLGRDTHADQVAERVFKTTRVIDFDIAVGADKRPSIFPTLRKLFDSLPAPVVQKAAAIELKSGNDRSRKFVLSHSVLLRIESPLTDELLGAAIREATRDPDSQTRKAAIKTLGSFTLQPDKSRFADSQINSFREALKDSVPEIAMLAAEVLRDVDSESKAIAESFARIVAKPDSPDQRVDALNQLAVMGPKAASVASQVAAVLLEPLSDETIRIAEFDGWLGTFRSERRNTFHFVAAVALARMGQAAVAELPTIQKALDNPDAMKGYENRTWADLNNNIQWPDLLRAVKSRLAEPATLDIRGGNINVVESAIRLYERSYHLLMMEAALLQQYHPKDPAIKQLIERGEAIKQDSTLANQLRSILQPVERPDEKPADVVWSLVATMEQQHQGRSLLSDERPTETSTGTRILADSPRESTIHQLSKLGPAARAALPMLKKESESKKKSAAAAENAIKLIEAAKDDKKAE